MTSADESAQKKKSRQFGPEDSASSLKGSVFEVEIERIIPGGLGLAHADGRTLFVSLSAPGDQLRVVIDRVQGQVAFASIVEILQSSPQRVEPPCSYFGRCGGCDFQQLSYQSQLDAKIEIVRDCLRRIARLDTPFEIRMLRAPDEWRYRARAQWQYDLRAKSFGYYERGTHRIIDVETCPVLIPELQSILTELRQEMPFDSSSRNSLGDFQSVAGDDGVSIAASGGGGGAPARLVSRRLQGENYLFSANGFFQINHQLLPELISEAVRDYSGDRALDLYCGVGLFSIPLARRFARVIGIEGVARAVASAERNAKAATLDNIQFVTAGVGAWLSSRTRQLREAGGVDLILLDPPRTGAEKETIAAILKLAPARISYVSCDPATLARDLRALTETKYGVETITALDMFPQTHHIETVVHLARRGPL